MKVVMSDTPPPSQPLSAHTSEEARKIDTMQKLLNRKLQQAEELRQKLTADVAFMKEHGM